mgnify:CR=1 FL=1
MKGTGFLTIVGCGLLAAFLLSQAGPAASAAPGQEKAAAVESEEETAEETESKRHIPENAVSENNVSENTVSGNDVSGNNVSGNNVSDNRISAKLLLRPSGGRRTDVSGNCVSGNGVSGNDVSGNSVSENTVSGNDVSSNSTSASSVSENRVSENAVSENRISKRGVSESSVSENEDSEKDISGNDASGNDISGNNISGNTVSENDVSRNSISSNRVSGNGLPDTDLAHRLTLKERQEAMSSHKQTMLANEQDRKTISGNDIDFSEIKIACLGDSITQAVNLDTLDHYQELAWPHILKEALGAEEVVNLGIGGSSIGRYWADAFVDRYTEIPEDTDLIFVMGGTNDGFCASFVEFGNSGERAPRTFWGDLDELMDGLKENYPDAEVIFLTPLPNSLHDYLKAERKYLMPQEEFSDVIITLAEEHGMEVFDLYNSNILDGHDKDNILHLMPDGVHPNAEGYRILGEHVAAELIRLLDERKEQLPEMSLPSEEQGRKEAGVNRSGSRQRMADAILLE